MKERPILFSGPMVRAILEGRKTQTRRILKPQPVGEQPGYYCDPYNKNYGHFTFWSKDNKMCNGQIGNVKGTCHWRPPYGLPGDRLWVRETFIAGHGVGGCVCGDLSKPINIIYKADYDGSAGPWSPSIHMPRRASRITLEIVNVKVERLNYISEQDVESEGIAPVTVELKAGEHSMGQRCFTSQELFQVLWESLNGPRSWEKNPWVWVIQFKRVV